MCKNESLCKLTFVLFFFLVSCSVEATSQFAPTATETPTRPLTNVTVSPTATMLVEPTTTLTAAPTLTSPTAEPEATATIPLTAQPDGQPSDWLLVFQDEFDGTELDADKWTTCFWWATEGCNIQTNNELEWYLPANAQVTGGLLELEAREELVTADEGRTFNYSSGMVTTGRATSDTETRTRFSFQYGYVEARILIPSGKGLWPAVWLLPADHQSRPEIDIIEVLGDSTDMARFTYHYTTPTGIEEDPGFEAAVGDLAAGWHSVAVDWQPEHIIWYLDGVEQWRIDDPTVISDEPMYLILNLAVGGDWPGAPDADTPFPSQFKVDYIRVWRRPEVAYLNLTADSHVDASQPSTNFGNNVVLTADGDPQSTIYLRFDSSVLAISSIETATLQLTTANDSGSGSANTFMVSLVPGAQWSEYTINYEEQPQGVWQEVGSYSEIADGSTFDIPLDTALIESALGGELTLAIHGSGADGLHILSRENLRNGPQLIVNTTKKTLWLPLIGRPPG